MFKRVGAVHYKAHRYADRWFSGFEVMSLADSQAYGIAWRLPFEQHYNT